MSERKQTVVRLFLGVVMLLSVSAYRQISIHCWPNDSVRPYIVYAVYLILLFLWQHSVNTKILQTGMRVHLTMQNFVGIFFLTVRFVQDAFLYNNISLLRFTGYFILVLAVLYPLFGLYAAFYLGKGEEYRIDKRWFLMFIPATVLIIMALTDEFHHFVCYILPEEPQPNVYFHPYIGAYIILLWAFGLIGYQIYIICKRCGIYRSKSLVKWLIPLYEPILLILFSIPYVVANFVIQIELVEYSAGMIFIAVLCWELYILIGLIPINTRYDEVFSRSTIAMRIYSLDGQRIVASEKSSDIAPDIFNVLKRDGYATTDHTAVFLHKSAENYIIWQTDLTAIQKTLEELSELNEQLEQNQELLAREIAVQSDVANTQVRNAIYDFLAKQVSPQLRLLKNLLGKNTPEKWGQITIVGTFIKRYCNLQLILQERDCIPIQDFQISLNDMISCMNTAGIQADLFFNPAKEFSPKLVLQTIKTLEDILEQAQFIMTSLHLQVEDVVAYTVSGATVSLTSRDVDDSCQLRMDENTDRYVFLLSERTVM